ncbi:32850813-ea30-45ec-b91a-e8044477fccf [Sclerotinia trifoliorum]|uniref:EKC/KEOPS complex subunit BUD32 n=1 Tax=Sclerotinia trifoliorum TaxID=28548 RepID=A0A8H2ZTE3_9HELO|nr:32850813-ea30-45ec-b91a-e8044477fccf [Sclerotinia trifoliorum]
MDSITDWKQDLKASERYDNILKLKKHLALGGLGGNTQKTAFEIESEAYNSSSSRAVYDDLCNPTEPWPNAEASSSETFPAPKSPGIIIGPYNNCHHISSGAVSQVYRCDTEGGSYALKVITETHNMEPHSPTREIAILKRLSHPSIISLHATIYDQESRLVLLLPYMPYTLSDLLSRSSKGLNVGTTKKIFKELLSGLAYFHLEQIIHRDISPSNILLPHDINGKDPIVITDFGTAWHPSISSSTEPADQKCLEVGTTCYRGPETLFSNTSYNTSLDLWSTGVLLAECLRSPPVPLLESRRGDEDGNQLGLILSMFKTLGTPTEQTWPEAMKWKTNPFQWWNIFPSKSWEKLLPDAEEDGRDLVASLVIYESGRRLTADQALNHSFFVEKLESRD